MNEIAVETLRTPAEMAIIEQLQHEIWGYGSPGADHPYPGRALFALVESGGLVSLARVEGEPAGFAVAWLGRRSRDQVLYLHSQLAGVRAGYRRRGIALALKLHQRSYALAQGIKLMRWTFDPVRTANARLNLSRLGAICLEFRPHFYGDLGSHFSQGDSTDRLFAEWYLDSPRVNQRLTVGRMAFGPETMPPPGREITRCETVQLSDGRESRRLVGWNWDGEDTAWVELPPDFDHLRQTAPRLAQEWRREIGAILTGLLGAGLIITDVEGGPEGTSDRLGYRIEQTPLDEVLQSG